MEAPRIVEDGMDVRWPATRLATPWERYLAFLLDGLVIVAWWVLAFALAHWLRQAVPPSVLVPAFMFCLFGFPVCYYAVTECSPLQATLGKRALGLIVTDTDGRRITLVRSLGRTVGKLGVLFLTVCFPPLIVAALSSWVSPFTLHDLIAGCAVLTAKAPPGRGDVASVKAPPPAPEPDDLPDEPVRELNEAILTGEIDLRLPETRFAPIWRRELAFLLDGSLILSCWFAIAGFGQSHGVAWLKVVGVAVAFLAPLAYLSLMECSPLQATLGKFALGLIVTGHDMKRISLLRSFARNGCKLLSLCWVPLVHVTGVVRESPRHYTLYDRLASCYVLLRDPLPDPDGGLDKRRPPLAPPTLPGGITARGDIHENGR